MSEKMKTYNDNDEISLGEASRITQTTPDAIRGAIKRGRIRGQKLGNVWVVRAGDIYDYIESKQTWHVRGQVRG